MERKSKINYYLDIAQTVSSRGTCLRKNFGAIIVRNDVIVSTGYNGAPREQMLGADLYLCCVDPASGELVGGTTSCQMCKRLVINAGIERVIVRENAEEFSIYNVEDWITNDDSLGQMGY